MKFSINIRRSNSFASGLRALVIVAVLESSAGSLTGAEDVLAADSVPVYTTKVQSIVIDVEAKLDTKILTDLQLQLSRTFWQPVQVNALFRMDFEGVHTLGEKQYMMEDLMRAYERLRPVSPNVHHVLLIDGQTYSPAKARNYSLSRADYLRGSIGVISIEVLKLPKYVTAEFAQRRLTERLYKSIKKRLIHMYGYQVAIPDCLLRFFSSVEYIDQLPTDVCPTDRARLEAARILRPLR